MGILLQLRLEITWVSMSHLSDHEIAEETFLKEIKDVEFLIEKSQLKFRNWKFIQLKFQLSKLMYS